MPVPLLSAVGDSDLWASVVRSCLPNRDLCQPHLSTQGYMLLGEPSSPDPACEVDLAKSSQEKGRISITWCSCAVRSQ